MIEVTEKLWLDFENMQKPKHVTVKRNGLQSKTIVFNKMSHIEGLKAAYRQTGCAVKPEINKIKQCHADMRHYQFDKLLVKSKVRALIRRKPLKAYIENVASQDKKKGEKLEQIRLVSRRQRIRGLKPTIVFFQKRSTDEPKFKSRGKNGKLVGDVVKPRGICSQCTKIKSKRQRSRLNTADKKAYEDYYNLYCNYISWIFVEAIKEAQIAESKDQENVAKFTHGLNSEGQVNQFTDGLKEMKTLTNEKIAYINSDFAKFDSSRHKTTLQEFDNKIIIQFINDYKEDLISIGYYPVDIANCKEMITTTTQDLVYRNSKKKVLFSFTLEGTVPSGFGPRTTLGNTLFNMGFQRMVTKGLIARTYAAGDDGAFIVLQKDIDTILERVNELTSKANEDKTHGLGLIIDSRVNVDDELIQFLSKVIDIKSQACVRQLERVYATGNVSATRIPQEELNYCVYETIESYLDMPFYSSMRDARDSLDMKKPGKGTQKNATFRKEMQYKMDFADPKVAYGYISRLYKDVVAGLDYNGYNDGKVLNRVQTDLEMSNQRSN